MWVQGYQGTRAKLQPWPDVIDALRKAPFGPRREALNALMFGRLKRELARDPEEEDVFSPHQLIHVMEAILIEELPWYGGRVVSFSNESLTRWAPQVDFLVQDVDRAHHTVEAILRAVSRLPDHLYALDRIFAPARAAVVVGQPPVDAIEGVLDHVITTTECKGDWQRTLFAAFLWMHEACGVPLPEARRGAIRRWLEQLCPTGYSPEPMTRAEILSAMLRSLQRPARW